MVFTTRSADCSQKVVRCQMRSNHPVGNDAVACGSDAVRMACAVLVTAGKGALRIAFESAQGLRSRVLRAVFVESGHLDNQQT